MKDLHKKIKLCELLFNIYVVTEVLYPVVQTLDSTIHRIKHLSTNKYRETNCVIHSVNRFFPVDTRYPTFEQPELCMILNYCVFTKLRGEKTSSLKS